MLPNCGPAGDPIIPVAALFPVDRSYASCVDPVTLGLTITYVDPTTARVDDQTNYVEE